MPEDGPLTPQQAAGATKRARNREKLINAAAYVMRRDEKGLDASVSDIFEDAGISSATFYTFYRSRNELCADAVRALITRPILESAHSTSELVAKDFNQRARGNELLISAALAHRYESYRLTGSAEYGWIEVVKPTGVLPTVRVMDNGDFVSDLAAALGAIVAINELLASAGLTNGIGSLAPGAMERVFPEGRKPPLGWRTRVDTFRIALYCVAVFMFERAVTSNPLWPSTVTDLLRASGYLPAPNFPLGEM